MVAIVIMVATVMVVMLVMVIVVNMVVMVDRTGQNRHLNLTFQATCDWQLLQFLRYFVGKLSQLAQIFYDRQF